MAETSFYNTPAWKALRAIVRKRDRYTCVMCGANVRGKGQSRVDHIIDRKTCPARALDITNLRTLCATCDNRRHRDKGGWQGKKEPKKEIGLDGYPVGW